MKTDAIGKEITVGSYITYEALNGRSAVLRIGRVKDVGMKVKASAACRGYSWRESKSANGWSRQRDVSLEFTTRIMVVDLPQELMELLKD